jgi:hypothetical protein
MNMTPDTKGYENILNMKYIKIQAVVSLTRHSY